MNEIYADANTHTVRSIIDRHAQQTPDAVFFISPESGKVVCYEYLKNSLLQLGDYLHAAPPDSVVGIMCSNGWATTQILLGVPYHGRTALIFNLASGDAQLLYMINHSECRLIFTDEENQLRLQSIVDKCENKIEIVLIKRDDDIGDSANIQQQDIEKGDNALPPITPHSTALLIYTSGTTGTPKGVLHSHRSLLFSGANTVAAHHLSATSRALCVLPLYHINGQCVTIFAPLISGGSVVIPHKFSVREFWHLLSQYQCTWFSAVPTIISHLLHGDAPPAPLPLLEFGRSASSALPPEIHRQFQEKFNTPLIETMGLTETAAQILSNPPPPVAGKIGSPGVAVGNEVKIVDGAGFIVPPNFEGEIAVRGDNLMIGYLREKSVFVDGWFMTGDLGTMDEDGYVFVTGRAKELIIKGGENIAPREIDDALYSSPAVVEAAAFAVECDVYGQQVEAAVVLSAACDEKELLDICYQAVGKFKSPRRIHFMESLPKGPSGKIQRLKLVELLGK